MIKIFPEILIHCYGKDKINYMKIEKEKTFNISKDDSKLLINLLSKCNRKTIKYKKSFRFYQQDDEYCKILYCINHKETIVSYKLSKTILSNSQLMINEENKKKINLNNQEINSIISAFFKERITFKFKKIVISIDNIIPINSLNEYNYSKEFFCVEFESDDIEEIDYYINFVKNHNITLHEMIKTKSESCKFSNKKSFSINYSEIETKFNNLEKQLIYKNIYSELCNTIPEKEKKYLEIEKKFILENVEEFNLYYDKIIYLLENDFSLKITKFELKDRYFDTYNQLLKKNNIAFRQRKYVGGKYTRYTVKKFIKEKNGFLYRNEFKSRFKSRNVPINIYCYATSKIFPLIQKYDLTLQDLELLCELKTNRISVEVYSNDSSQKNKICYLMFDEVSTKDQVKYYMEFEKNTESKFENTIYLEKINHTLEEMKLAISKKSKLNDFVEATII